MIKGEPTLESMLAELEQLVEHSSDGLGLQGLADSLQATTGLDHDGHNHYLHITRFSFIYHNFFFFTDWKSACDKNPGQFLCIDYFFFPECCVPSTLS